MKKVSERISLFFTLILGLALFTSGCGKISVGYTPPFVPVLFALDSSGNISISGNLSVVTPLGTFSVNADVYDTQQAQENSILLVIRHQQDGSIVDTAYQISAQEQVVVDIDGKSTIDVTNQRVMIDASQGNISCIEVKDSTSDSTCSQPSSASGQTTAASNPASETWTGKFNQEGGFIWDVQLVVTRQENSLSGTWSFGDNNSGQYTNGSVQVEGAIVTFDNLTQQVQNDLTNYFGLAFQASQQVVSWHGTGASTGTIWPNGRYYAVRFGNELRGIAYEDSQSSTFSNFRLSSSNGNGQLGN